MTIRADVAVRYVVAVACCASCRQEGTRTQGSTASLATRAASESTTPAPERPLASRQEAQPFLDSAGVLLVGGDTNAAVVILHRAAAVVQMAASQPRGPASSALEAMGDSIDRYASAQARHESLRSSPLPRLSTLLNLAEADRHLSLASIACSTRSRESIYDELTMALDHVERASRDGQLRLATPTRNAIAELRRASAALATECAQDLAPVDDAIAILRREIADMRRRVALSSS
jgi:hypothetical protein